MTLINRNTNLLNRLDQVIKALSETSAVHRKWHYWNRSFN